VCLFCLYVVLGVGREGLILRPRCPTDFVYDQRDEKEPSPTKGCRTDDDNDYYYDYDYDLSYVTEG
jgi:hypothetical protein